MRAFLEAAVQALSAESGQQYLQHCKGIHSDRTWSMTLCGIVTQRNVIDWLNKSIKKTVPGAYSATPSTRNPFTSSATTTSKGSATCTSSTIAAGYPENGTAPGLTGTYDPTLTGGLLSHIKSLVSTGCASSVIYLSDEDGSYKFGSESKRGDIQLDFRVYPMTAVMSEEPKNLWRHSVIRGKIAVRSKM